MNIERLDEEGCNVFLFKSKQEVDELCVINLNLFALLLFSIELMLLFPLCEWLFLSFANEGALHPEFVAELTFFLFVIV